MAESRPLLEWPLEQLEEHAAMHAADSAILVQVLEEVEHRPGRAAKALARRIRTRIEAAALPGAPSQTARSAIATEVAVLRRCLAAAAEEIETLRRRLAEAEACGLRAAAPSPHARVHLAPTAPLWLVAEARRAFRRRFHPDRYADPEIRARAEQAFKAAEEVFARIEAAEPPDA